jgi:hypothetical protein
MVLEIKLGFWLFDFKKEDKQDMNEELNKQLASLASNLRTTTEHLERRTNSQCLRICSEEQTP